MDKPPLLITPSILNIDIPDTFIDDMNVIAPFKSVVPDTFIESPAAQKWPSLHQRPLAHEHPQDPAHTHTHAPKIPSPSLAPQAAARLARRTLRRTIAHAVIASPGVIARGPPQSAR